MKKMRKDKKSSTRFRETNCSLKEGA
uniref:Uncharacterized protein n=1 Tax=Tetranychus urticae TaxID=32264 RepID=T1KE14_TETUR